MMRFFTHFLFVLSTSTLLIKHVLPTSWSLAEGVPVQTYIY